MKKAQKPQDKFMAPVKIGPKGQIVIPKEVRDMFGLEPGDTMLLLADKKQGIALQEMSLVNRIVSSVFANKNASEGEQIYAQHAKEALEKTPENEEELQEGNDEI